MSFRRPIGIVVVTPIVPMATWKMFLARGERRDQPSQARSTPVPAGGDPVVGRSAARSGASRWARRDRRQGPGRASRGAGDLLHLGLDRHGDLSARPAAECTRLSSLKGGVMIVMDDADLDLALEGGAGARSARPVSGAPPPVVVLHKKVHDRFLRRRTRPRGYTLGDGRAGKTEVGPLHRATRSRSAGSELATGGSSPGAGSPRLVSQPRRSRRQPARAGSRSLGRS